MAPLKSVKKVAADKRVQGVLDLAGRTLHQLKERLPASDVLAVEIETAVRRTFPLPPSTSLVGKAASFDALGSQLWNIATNILREDEAPQDPRRQKADRTRLICILHTFGFFLIDTAHHTSSKGAKDGDQRIRMFKIALKTCRFCLDKDELELAQRVFERCSDDVGAVEEASPVVRLGADQGDDQRLCLKPLVSEFYLLRMTHAWKSERLDLADHFASKVQLEDLAASASLAEKAADLFHETGKALYRRQLMKPAAQWWNRALSALDAVDVEQLTQDGAELRLAIAAGLVDILIVRREEDALKRAWSLTEQLDVRCGLGNRMVVTLMQLKILLSTQPVDSSTLSTIISRMIRQGVLTAKTFKIVMQSIHKVKRVSTDCALRALNELITVRLLPDIAASQESNTNRDWLEKAIVTFVMFTVTAANTSNPQIDALQALLDTVGQQLDGPLSAKATHAAQTLMWKAAGTSTVDVANQWCKLLRHPVFDSAGTINKARIGRKTMITAMERNDLESARTAFFQMPARAQNDDMTRYLAFKLALRTEDYELATDSLATILRHSDSDQTFLYACVLEAQQSTSKQMAIVALQAILEKSPRGVHLPTLLRCTVRLMISELESLDRPLDQVMAELLRVFESAANNTKSLRQGTDEQWRAEIQWWSKNVYNLVLRLCDQAHPEHLVRLLTVCIKFLDCYPDDGGLMHHDDLVRRKLICYFLASSALVVLGRSNEEAGEYSLQCYVQARHEIEKFEVLRKQARIGKDDGAHQARVFEMLKFDLEAIFKLKQWNQLIKAMDACLELEGVDRWETLADLVIVIHDQARAMNVEALAMSKVPDLLQRIINETWKKDKDIVKVAQWMRITFSIDLSDSDGSLGRKLLLQAATLARRGQEGKHDLYPSDELQWLSTTAFNKAVDLLSAGDKLESNAWTEGALELARYNNDNGSLHAQLTRNREQAEARLQSGAL